MDCSIDLTSVPPLPETVCLHCGTIPPGGGPFDPVASAFVDHILAIEAELAELQRMVEDVVL
jgi:hypothetical protein